MILAVTLTVVGQLDLATMAADHCDFERALALSDSSRGVQGKAASLFRARMLIELQRGEEALKEIDRIPLLAPELFVPGQRSYLKAMALGLTKRFDEAARELALAEKAGFDPALIEGERAIADLEQGRWVEAERRLQRLLSTPRAMKELTSSVYNFAILRSKQGRQAEALELLRTAVASGFGDLRQLATDPDFDALRRVFPKEVNAMVERATGRCSTW